MTPTPTGYKLLTADGRSLSDQYTLVFYPLPTNGRPGRWIDVLAPGAFIAVKSGLWSGGFGPRLAAVEAEEPGEHDAPDGVRCYRRVRVLWSVDLVSTGVLDRWLRWLIEDAIASARSVLHLVPAGERLPLAAIEAAEAVLAAWGDTAAGTVAEAVAEAAAWAVGAARAAWAAPRTARAAWAARSAEAAARAAFWAVAAEAWAARAAAGEIGEAGEAAWAAVWAASWAAEAASWAVEAAAGEAGEVARAADGEADRRQMRLIVELAAEVCR